MIVSLPGDSLAAMCSDADRMRARIDELLCANNDLVERRREAERRANGLQDTLDNTLLELAEARRQRDDMGEGFLSMTAVSAHHLARAKRAEAIVHGIIRESESSDWSAFADEVVPETRVATPEWAFGPWVQVPDGGSPKITGPYQMRARSSGWVNPTIRNGNPGGEWHGTDYRRAYRIGQWHVWDGSAECPRETGARVQFDCGYGESDPTHIGNREWASWRTVKRFRPLAPAQAKA